MPACPDTFYRGYLTAPTQLSLFRYSGNLHTSCLLRTCMHGVRVSKLILRARACVPFPLLLFVPTSFRVSTRGVRLFSRLSAACLTDGRSGQKCLRAREMCLPPSLAHPHCPYRLPACINSSGRIQVSMRQINVSAEYVVGCLSNSRSTPNTRLHRDGA